MVGIFVSLLSHDGPTLRTSKTNHSSHRSSYLERINRVLDHIVANLADPLPLSELAKRAKLSPFHFHRIFQAMLGETPNDYVKRLRLERALRLMSFGKPKSLTSIALECGFSSSSDFTRSFKLRYGVAPSKFDLVAWRTEHGARLESAAAASSMKLLKMPARTNPDQFRVRLRLLAARNVAYLRVSNPYQGDRVVQGAKRLVEWVQAQQLTEVHWLGYQYENPEVTALEQCHYYVAVEVREAFEPKGEIGLFRFPAMQVAEVEMQGDIEKEIRLLQWLYGSWLPRSHYEPADHPCFEVWAGRPFDQGSEQLALKIQLPVR